MPTIPITTDPFGPLSGNVGSKALPATSLRAVDPQGRYLYTTMRNVVKELDQFRIDPPQFVAIDLQDKKIAKAWPFPKEMNQGFGFNATYKVSADGKRLYVFQENILIFDLDTFKQVDSIELAQPLDGRKRFRGRLLGTSEGKVRLATETGETSWRLSPTLRPRRSAKRRPTATESSSPKPFRLPHSTDLSPSPRHWAR